MIYANKRSMISVSCILLVILLGTLVLPPAAEAILPFDVDAESAILIEAQTGKIIFQKNPDMQLPPASMSKMMTELLVMEAIDRGQFNWDTVVTASSYAHFFGRLEGTSRVWLAERERRTVEELYTAMAVYSANDATVALAELVAGSESRFVEMMNQKALEIGMTNTQFFNSTGLPNRMLGNYIPSGTAEDENLMSARDTAILARYLATNYPKVFEFSSIPDIPSRNVNPENGIFDVRLINFNWMIEGHPNGGARPHAYPGLDGLKTGFTEAAGYCFTGTAVKDGIRYISVVMRSESNESRFRETRKLLDYGFNHFKFEEVATAGDTLPDFITLPVAKGLEKEVGVHLGGSITTLLHRNEQDKYRLQFVPNDALYDEEGKLIAPVAQGDILGEVHLIYDGNINYAFIDGSPTLQKTDLMATEDIEKAGWFKLFMRSIGQVFGNIWSGIKGWFV